MFFAICFAQLRRSCSLCFSSLQVLLSPIPVTFASFASAWFKVMCASLATLKETRWPARTPPGKSAELNLPIRQGYVLATDKGRAEVEFENGSMAFLRMIRSWNFTTSRWKTARRPPV